MANESAWVFSAKADNAVKGLQGIATHLAPIQKITTSLSKQGGVVGAAVGDPEKASATVKILGQLNDELTRQKKALAGINAERKQESDLTKYRKLTDEAEQYRAKIESIKDEIASVRGKTNSNDFGFKPSIFTPTQTASMVAYQFGGMGAGAGVATAVNQIGDVGTAVSQLENDFRDLAPAIEDNIKNLGGLFTQMRNAGGVGKAASVGLQSITTAISPLAVSAIGAVGTLALVTSAINMVADRTEKVNEADQRYLDALSDEFEIKQRISNLSQQGDVSGIQQTINDAAAERANIQQQIDAEQRRQQDILQRWRNANFFDVITKFDLKGQYEDSKQKLADLYGRLAPILNTIESGMDAMPDTAATQAALAAADRLKEAESELTQTRLSAQDATKQFTKSLQDFTDNIAFSAQMTSRERAHQSILDETQHARDLAKIQKDGGDQIQSIVKDYTKSVAGIYKDALKAEAEATKQLQRSIAQQDKQYQKDVGKTWKDYNKSRAKEEAQWAKEKEKEEKQWAKDELRRREDLHDSQLDAEFANDAVAFLQAKRAADKEEKRAQEDHQDQLDEEALARQDARDQEWQDLQDQLTDLAESRDEARQEMLDSYAQEQQDRQEALKERLQEEKAAEKERLAEQIAANGKALTDAQEAYDLQRQLQEEQYAWEDETTRINNQRQLDQMQTSFNDQMDALKQHEADLLVVVESGGKDQVAAVTYKQLELVSAYQDGANKAIAAVKGAFAGAAFGSGGGSGGSSGYVDNGSGFYIDPISGASYGGVPFANGKYSGIFADRGAVVDRPTFTLLGERRPEAVVPLAPGGGLSADIIKQLGGGMHVSLDFSGMNIGAGVSEQVLKAQLVSLGATLVQAIRDARLGVPYSEH